MALAGGGHERETTEDGWAPPTAEESRQAIRPSRARKPRRALLTGLDAGLFTPQCCPEPHDWLCGPGVKDRGGQTFAQFNMENRRKPGPGDVIRLVPLGDFGSDLEVDWLLEVVRRFFGGMTVQMHERMPDEKVLKRVKSRKSLGFGTQLWTSDIHDHLQTLHGRVRGSNAFATMAFTLFDLYPKEEWNFVFGQARPMKGTGVFSFARYRGKDPQEFRMRCAKVLCHELGHLFGMSHCIWYDCLMCGSNGDWESDRHPPHLCPVELAKLDAALGGGLDIAKREGELEEFWRESGFEEEAEWCRQHREALEVERDRLKAGSTQGDRASGEDDRRAQAIVAAGAAPSRRPAARQSVGTGASTRAAPRTPARECGVGGSR